MAAAEFGCGSGGFTVPLAKKLDDGMVYAIDILREPLSALSSHLRLARIKNVRVIKSNLEKIRGSTLQDDSMDLVVIPNTLFQIESKKSIIIEAKRVLKTGGILAVMDWKEKVSEKEIKELCEKNGFQFQKNIDAGSHHYGLVFLK